MASPELLAGVGRGRGGEWPHQRCWPGSEGGRGGEWPHQSCWPGSDGPGLESVGLHQSSHTGVGSRMPGRG